MTDNHTPVTVLAHPKIADMLKRRNITGDSDIRSCPDVAEDHAVVTRNGRVEKVFLWNNGWHLIEPSVGLSHGGDVAHA